MSVVIDGTDGITVPQGASQAEAEAGTSNTVLMTPLRTSQAIAALASSISTIDVQEFDASGTWTKPANAVFCDIDVVGAGQGGSYGRPSAMCVTAIPAKAGNSGGWGSVTTLASSVTSTVTVTVGAGGTINTTFGGDGGTGGTSSFGTYVTATGGGTSPGVGGGTSVFEHYGLFADSPTWGAPSTVGYGGYLNTRTPRNGAGGGGGGTTSVATVGGGGYVRITTYCS